MPRRSTSVLGRLEDARAVARGVGADLRARAALKEREFLHQAIMHQRPQPFVERRGSASVPSSANAESAMPTGSSASSTSAPEAFSVLRTSACAQTAPNRPVLAPITAHGFSRSTLSGNGREAQSIAFLSAPGSDALYSGVAISSASAPSIASRNSRTASGGESSRSSSKAGRLGEPVPLHQLGPGREQRARRPEQPAVVGSPAQAAGDAEDPHRLGLSMSEMSTVSVTSLASALAPEGSGMFQFISHCVRSMTASSCR